MVHKMRKITQEAVKAFLEGQVFHKDNTQIKCDKYNITMQLHGNPIAITIISTREINISNAGWPTPTTKERLNGLLDALGVPGIYQKRGVWYWKGGEEFPNNQFVEV
jgi:hypothetical protein